MYMVNLPQNLKILWKMPLIVRRAFTAVAWGVFEKWWKQSSPSEQDEFVQKLEKVFAN